MNFKQYILTSQQCDNILKKGHDMRSFFLGFFVATTMCFGALISYVMFCPHYEEKYKKIDIKPEVKVKVKVVVPNITIEPSKVFILPIRQYQFGMGQMKEDENPTKKAPSN